ncbi:hypothetical protein HMPREF1022_01121 [Desulfovibrio sp. 6_1_46AFAA]|nr:hypothetical protein HMPREF1022_01121 [Desulfovibrio sp. 6_1_46AFAA]
MDVTVNKPAEGQEVRVDATVTDPAGNEATANDTAHLDATAPAVGVEITTDANNDEFISKDELGDGEITAHVTLGEGTAAGDTLVVTDQSGKEIFNGLVTDEMLSNGLDVTVTKPAEGQEVRVDATVTDPAGNSDTANDTALLPHPVNIGSGEETLNEADADAHTASGAIDVELAGAGTIKVGGETFDVPEGEFSTEKTIASEGKGELHLTVGRDADGNLTIMYEYAIADGGAQHGDPGYATDENLSDSFALEVSDGVNSETGSLDITIVDGTPTLTVNGEGYHQDAVVSGSTINREAGSIGYDFGMDDRDGKSFTVQVDDTYTYDITNIAQQGSVTLDGSFGKLTINADGSYSYTAKPGIKGGAHDSFVLTITDADGDSKDVKLDMAVQDEPRVTVDEKGLDDGDDASESATITVPEGFTIVGVAVDGQGAHGTVSQDSSGAWQYTLHDAINSGPNAGPNTVEGGDSIRLVVEDAAGNQSTIEMPVDIIDDVPTITGLDGSSVHAGESAGDTFLIDMGADAGGATLEFTVDDGDQSVSLTHNADGTWSAELSDGSSVTVSHGEGNEYQYTFESGHMPTGGEHTLHITATDGDGDIAHESVVLRAENQAPVAHDDVFHIDKVVTGPSSGSVSVSATIAESHAVITVGGVANNVSYVDTSAVLGGYKGITSGNHTQTGEDFFSKFFQDAAGHAVDMDALARADNTLTFDWGGGSTLAQLQNAADQAAKGGKLLYITGNPDVTGKLTLNCVTIVDGDCSFKGNSSALIVNGFLYTSGNLNLNNRADLTVSGGLAVDGNLNASKNSAITAEHTKGASGSFTFTTTDYEEGGGESHGEKIISFDDLVHNDSDPDHHRGEAADNDGLHLKSITITDSTGTEHVITEGTASYTVDGGSIKVDWEKGEISVSSDKGNIKDLNFQYTVEDKHGAQDTADVQVQVTSEQTAGTQGSDLIQGSTGAFAYGGNYNISIAFDTSGSMKNNGFTTAQDALKHYVDSLHEQAVDSHAASVKVLFVSFSSNALQPKEYDLTKDADLTALKATIDQLTATGGTNYMAVFDIMSKWFQEHPGAENKTIFITDGVPTFYYPDKITVRGGATVDIRGMAQGDTIQIGDYEYTLTTTPNSFPCLKDNYSREWEAYKGTGNTDVTFGVNADSYNKLNGLSDIEAVGIGSGVTQNGLNQYDSDGQAHVINSSSELEAALNQLFRAAPASDTIFGNLGDDVLFGDAARMQLEGNDLTLAAYVAAMLGQEDVTPAVIVEYVKEHAEEIQDHLVHNEYDQSDALIGGAGNDVLFGQGGDDLLIGDGSNAANEAQNTLDYLRNELNAASGKPEDLAHAVTHAVTDDPDQLDALAARLEGLETPQDGNDQLFGGSGDDVLLGMGGDDKLYGGDGSDILFGGSGNDYLDGGNDTEVDYLHGGSGNDMLVYHPNDVIDGGSGMDVLLVGNDSMDSLFRGGQLDANVTDVEVIISGEDVSNLTNMDALGNIGITLGDNSLSLGDGWTKADDAPDGYHAYTNGDVTVTVAPDVHVDTMQEQSDVAAINLMNNG